MINSQQISLPDNIHLYIIVAAIILLLYVLSKSKNPKKVTPQQYDLYLTLQNLEKNYNNTVDIMQLNYKSYYQKAHSYQDIDSLTQLNDISGKFNQSCLDFKEVDSIVAQLIEAKKYQNATLQIQHLKDLYEEMNKSITDIEDIKDNIFDYRKKEQEANQNAYNDSSFYSNANTNTRQTSKSTFLNNKETFFEGCKTEEELTKRYKLLAKALHPDSGCGSEELFNTLKFEYEQEKAKYQNS